MTVRLEKSTLLPDRFPRNRPCLPFNLCTKPRLDFLGCKNKIHVTLMNFATLRFHKLYGSVWNTIHAFEYPYLHFQPKTDLVLCWKWRWPFWKCPPKTQIKWHTVLQTYPYNKTNSFKYLQFYHLWGRSQKKDLQRTGNCLCSYRQHCSALCFPHCSHSYVHFAGMLSPGLATICYEASAWHNRKFHIVIRYLSAKDVMLIEIHRQLTEV
jgi:hypothetical protein